MTYKTVSETRTRRVRVWAGVRRLRDKFVDVFVWEAKTETITRHVPVATIGDVIPSKQKEAMFAMARLPRLVKAVKAAASKAQAALGHIGAVVDAPISFDGFVRWVAAQTPSWDFTCAVWRKVLGVKNALSALSQAQDIVEAARA